MPMSINTNPSQQFAEALQSGDTAAIATAWDASMSAIAQSVRDDYEALQNTNDAAVLAQRGIRQLTAQENKFYEKFTQVLRHDNPKQAFIDLIGADKDEDLMPVTIIEDVFKDLVEEHKLLQVIEFNYTGYATKWIRNAHEATKAVWGKITDEITKEITSDLELMKIENNKLSAFCVIPIDILDMGYAFLDAYIRRVLAEAVYCGLEDGIINGTGVNEQPVGLVRDVHEGVSVNTSTGYPKKEAIAVTSFEKKTYCGLVANLAMTEKGKNRNVTKVALLVNSADYLTKIAPATMLLGNAGYVHDVFPFPTECIQSTQMAAGEALMFLPKGYNFCVGGKRNGTIEFDDSIGFLDDTRTFKIIQHGDGIADDNTVAILLDISNLEELIPTVKTIEAVPTV